MHINDFFVPFFAFLLPVIFFLAFLNKVSNLRGLGERLLGEDFTWSPFPNYFWTKNNLKIGREDGYEFKLKQN